MTDSEIIKALECCSKKTFAPCGECPCWCEDKEECEGIDCAEILDLINRQMEEIERLEKKIEGYEKIRRAFQKYILEHEWTDLWDIATKEFAERMKNRLENGPFWDWSYEYITMFNDIEEVEKEMTEGQNDV